MDSISVEDGEAVVFLIFSLVSVQRRENVAGSYWNFSVLDLMISLFNIFSGILCPPFLSILNNIFFYSQSVF